MPIVLENFIGAIPRVNPRLLAPNAAELLTDVRLERGDYEPMRADSLAYDFGSAPTAAFTRYAGQFIGFADANTRAVPAPTADDRLVVMAPSHPPRVWTPTLGFDVLAVAAPAGAPTNFVTIIGAVGPQPREESVVYAQTWVTSLGEESRPSPLSTVTSGRYNAGWGISMTLPGTPSGRITRRRIYRSKTTATGATELFFRAEIPATQTTYDDFWNENDLQEPCPTLDWNAPSGTMRGVVSMPNGILAAHSTHELFFSEPYVPHAWPRKYSITIPDKIVALAAFGTSLAVLTDGTPYVVQGLHPEAMAVEKMEASLPCTSARSAVDMGYSAIYASYDGLVEVTATGAKLISRPLWTREQWSNLNPQNMVASYYNGRYALRLWNGAWTVTLIDTAGETPYLITTTSQAEAIQYDPYSSRLMILNGGRVFHFDTPSQPFVTSAAWQSKPFEHSPPESYGAAFVHASTVRAGAMVLVFGDGQLLAEIPHTQFNRPVRLPAGYRNVWQVTITGPSVITKVVVARTMHEARAL